ncbi:complement C1q-like protein 3 [Echeneis naucrates]|nr:complement C1q-like protein 3 [Echeneis naucrates]
MAAFNVIADEGGAFGPFSDDRILIYNKVLTNICDAYDPSTGVFTAPTAGLYYFTFFYHAGEAHGSNLSLRKNDQHLVMTSDHRSSPGGGDAADNGGNATVLNLKKGDKVSVHMAAGSHVWATAAGHTTFSGFLIKGQ